MNRLSFGLVAILLLVGGGPVWFAAAKAPIASASGDVTPSDGWLNAVDAQWGGHFKLRGSIAWPAEDSVFAAADPGPYFDVSAEMRLKGEWYAGDRVKLESHYELVFSGGDTRSAAATVQRRLPYPSIRGRLGTRIPEDDRRFFDLTSVISDGPDHILYHRIDRLAVTLTPEWGVVKIGRQAVTWGNGLLFNPMDLFNPFSPTDIERDYKLGDDMLSVSLPLSDSGNLSLLAVPRRDPADRDLSWNHSSLAAKYHLFHGMTEFDFLAARHYRDIVLGIGSVGYLGGAAWRIDLTWTLPDETGSSQDFLSLVANLDYSWVWFQKNVYGFIEFFLNGAGEARARKVIENTDLLERIDRGDLFASGRAYLGGNLRMELHPLVNLILTSVANLNDPSGVLQPRVTYDMTQNSQLLIGANLSWGPENSEFGGIEIPGTELTTQPSDSIFLWVSYYF